MYLNTFMKKLFFVFAWIWLASGVILTGIASLKVYSYYQEQQKGKQVRPVKHTYRSIIDQLNPFKQGIKQTNSYVVVDDARPLIVQNFLERYHSPLAKQPNFAKKLVEIADENEIDFRLLPAIAMKESGLCKFIPKESHNCLGLGIHSRGTWGFDSYEANFRAAAKILKQNYINQGRTTPEKIMHKYTPSSNGDWAAGVNQFMSEMKYNNRQKGIEAVKEQKENNVLEYAQPSRTSTPAAQIQTPTSR